MTSRSSNCIRPARVSWKQACQCHRGRLPSPIKGLDTALSVIQEQFTTSPLRRARRVVWGDACSENRGYASNLKFFFLILYVLCVSCWEISTPRLLGRCYLGNNCLKISVSHPKHWMGYWRGCDVKPIEPSKGMWRGPTGCSTNLSGGDPFEKGPRGGSQVLHY